MEKDIVVETIASELYGKSFAMRSLVVLEPSHKRYCRRILSPEAKERQRLGGYRLLIHGLRAKLKKIYATDCIAESEKRAAARAPFLPIPPRFNNGQYGINFAHGNTIAKKLDYIVGRPYNYALTG